MGKLPVIKSLWVGGEISTMEKMCIKSFLKNGHDFHLYTYERVKGVPNKSEVKDAKQVIPKEKLNEFQNKERLAIFADLFRYRLLQKRGGVWVDMDMICLRPFNFYDEIVIGSERTERSRWELRLPSKAINSVMVLPKKSKIAKYCYEKCKKMNLKKVEWGKTGPDLVQEAVEKLGYEESIVPFWYFCPVSWWKWNRFIDDSVKVRLVEYTKQKVLRPYSYHLWNSRWTMNNAEKEKIYPENTIYGSLQRQLLY